MKLLIMEDNAAARRVNKSIVVSLAEEIHEGAIGAEALTAYTRVLQVRLAESC